jgi:GT2 family glycosyltransferase
VAGAAVTRGEFVFFVDDDNIVERRCLSTLVEVARAHPRIGILGPLMLEFPDGTGTWCAGATHERFGLVDYRARDGSELVPDARDPSVLEPCDFLPNAFLIRGDLARGALALDAKVFPGAWGESDLGLRARRAGYEVRVAPAARVWHDHGYRRLSVRLLNRDRIVDQARARILIRRRHREVFGSLAAYLLVTFPATTGYYLFRFARERRLREWGSAYATGTWHGLFDPIPPPPR